MGLLYSEANPTMNTNINAVSGTITKTFRKSYFVNYEFGSYLAKGLFDKERPNLGSYSDWGYKRGKEVIVLQTMLCGDGRLISEVINKEDYDEMFNNGSEENE